MVNIKKIVKRSIHHAAANFGRHTKTTDQPQLLILMYHRILPSDSNAYLLEEPGMTVTPEIFRNQMQLVKQFFKMVHLSKWLELNKRNAGLPQQACAITFDDGWVDNYEFAYPILKELEIPATIFLVSDMIGGDITFWPERLISLIVTLHKQPETWSHKSLDWVRKLYKTASIDINSITAPTRDQLSDIIATAKSLTDSEINQRIDTIEKELSISSSPKTPALLNWDQVNEMSSSGVIEFGSHTCNHIRLNNGLNTETLSNEIINSKEHIESRTGVAVKTFCYPNGDTSSEAEQLVRAHYDGAVTTNKGWNTKNSNPYLLQRIGIHEDISNDKVSFLARISDWL